jgi:hypothetical protein
MRVFQDDLPVVSISRLRASGVITAETTEFVVKLGDIERTVGVRARRFPSGGGWSSFLCPSCGIQVRLLRLLNGEVICCRCCASRGVGPRCWPMNVQQRAEHRIPKLLAKLESEVSLRLKPGLRGTMERRQQLELSLRQSRLVLRQHNLRDIGRLRGK